MSRRPLTRWARPHMKRLVNKLKQFRAVATRCDKTAESFLAVV